MIRNVFNFGNTALLVSVLLLGAPAVLGQMNGGPPAGGQNGNMNQQPGMNQPGMSPNMQPNPGMQQPNSAQSAQEQNFIGTMRRNIDVETELSKLAMKNSGNDNVKKFAQQVISENRSVESKLIMPVSNGGGPTFAAPIPSETRKAEKQMKKMTGAPFDGMYLSQIDAYVKDDQKITSDPSLANSVPDLRDVVMQRRVQADQRAQQITQVAQSENIKFQ